MAFDSDSVEIAQKAQTLATLTPMSSFEDTDSLEATIASEIYEEEVQALLCQEPWRFAVGQVQLNHLTDAPTGRWSDAWQIPTEPAVLAIMAVTENGVNIRFDRYGDKIFCDYNEDSTLVMDYVYRADETDWPADFKIYVIYHLASVFAAVITRQEELIQTLTNLAERKLIVAKRNHSQGRSSSKVNTKRIVTSRF